MRINDAQLIFLILVFSGISGIAVLPADDFPKWVDFVNSCHFLFSPFDYEILIAQNEQNKDCHVILKIESCFPSITR